MLPTSKQASFRSLARLGAMSHSQATKPTYQAIVDMGSNGIRFSITDTAPSTARILPVVYQQRAGISLYDAQWERGQAIDISTEIITQVTKALKAFKRTCFDFGVLQENIRIVATEATRTAKNSSEFQKRIKNETGLVVEMYPKEVEGLVGAYGVASSFEQVRGLVMDLGGGSTQITWLVFPDSNHPEHVNLSSKHSVSMPYGAAALTRRLNAATQDGPHAVIDLKKEITASMRAAVESIDIPPQLLHEASVNGLSLYLSGGGFRGWGYVQMHQHSVQPYPIPLINGFRILPRDFYDIDRITSAVKEFVSELSSQIFRVSTRRAAQVPAVAFLVSCLVDTLPAIKDVFFCQGGVREGTIFRALPPEVRIQDPLQVATAPYRTSSTPALNELLLSALPTSQIPRLHGSQGSVGREGEGETHFSPADIAAFTHTLYIHAALPIDIRAAAALRSTTTGLFAGVHGLSHLRRAALAIFLCESYGGVKELSSADSRFYKDLARLLPERRAWWAVYLGRVAGLVRAVWPAGVVGGEGIGFEARWVEGGEGKKGGKWKRGDEVGKEGKTKLGELQLTIAVKKSDGESESVWTDDVQKMVKGVEKAGKKKTWLGFEHGFGVDVRVVEQ